VKDGGDVWEEEMKEDGQEQKEEEAVADEGDESGMEGQLWWEKV
jgi:hypothetical protein